jgi:hypothetical protein
LAEAALAVLHRLELDDFPMLLERDGPEAVQQHRLTYSTEAGDDHGLIRTASAESTEQIAECRRLLVAPDEDLGLSSGVGRVGIAQSVHARTLQALVRFMRKG